MESWWTTNSESFARRGMVFDGHACVTTTRGKGGRCQPEYEESVTSVKRLIPKYCAPSPWQIEKKMWFVAAVKALWNFCASSFDIPPANLNQTLRNALSLVGYGQRETEEVVNEF
jgi:hypothetical protein